MRHSLIDPKLGACLLFMALTSVLFTGFMVERFVRTGELGLFTPNPVLFPPAHPSTGSSCAVPGAPPAPTVEPLDYINRIHIQFSDSQQFGIVCPRLRDPRGGPERPKRLTQDEK